MFIGLECHSVCEDRYVCVIITFCLVSFNHLNTDDLWPLVCLFNDINLLDWHDCVIYSSLSFTVYNGVYCRE